MLSQTKYTKDDLIKCGIKKADLIVRTPFNYKQGGWDNPSITILNSVCYCNFKTIRALLRLFDVTISIKDNKPIHICVYYNYFKRGKLLIYDFNTNEFKRI